MKANSLSLECIWHASWTQEKWHGRLAQVHSRKAICQELNGLLQGWFEYFKHSKSNVFATIDSYTRDVVSMRRRWR